MIKKRGKEIYQPPYAQDLSGLGAIGQVKPMGACVSGGQLTSGECANGAAPIGGNCAPTGSLPDLGYCRTGGDAREGCVSGSIHH